MAEDIRAYLQSKGVAFKEAPPDDINCACFFCGEASHKRGRLYINVNSEPPGLYKCHLCGDTGAFNRIRKHFGDPAIWDDATKDEEEAAYNRLAILNEAAAYYHDLLADNEHAYLYLRDERGFTLETIQAHQFGWADGTLANHLTRVKKFPEADVKATGLVDQFGHDFLNGYLTIPYMTNGNVVQIRGRKYGESSHGAKYKTPSGQKGRLFNTDLVWEAKEVVLCEGEFDAVVLEQLGYAAVGVPGAVSWQDAWNDYFTNARKVYIVFDNDTAGEAGAEKVARSVGPRSRIVKMPEHGPGESKNDPTEWIVSKGHSRDDFQMLLIKGKGGHLLTVDDGYVEWLESMASPGLKLGIEAIDAKIVPGLKPAQVMVVLAKTGAGKTILTLNLFHRIMLHNPHAKILFVSLEQTRSEWFDRARKIYRFYNPEARDEAVLGFFRDHLMLMDKNRVREEELVSCLEQYEFEMGQKPDLVAVDYLGYWARSFDGKPYERTSTAIMVLKAIAKEHRIAFLAPHQVSRVAHFGEEMEADVSRDSVVGDTRIHLADGRYVPISELVGTNPQVVSMDRNYKTTVVDTVRVWKKGDRETFRVTTRTGRQFVATPEHPMLTADREWVSLSELVPGDQIAIPDAAPMFGREPLDHAELLGHLVADGALTRTPITYTEGVPSVLEHVRELVRMMGVEAKDKPGEPTLVLSTARGQSNPVTDLVRSAGMFGLKSPVRFIPSVVFQADQESVAAFLRGLWSSDGTVTSRGLCYSSASERLARDVQHMLVRFGIRSVLTREPYQSGSYIEGWYWRVAVRQSPSLLIFVNKIGLVGSKQQKLEEVAAQFLSRPLSHHVDLFPASLLDQIHEARKANGFGWNVLSRTGNPKKTSLVLGRKIRRDKLLRLAEAVGSIRLRRLAISDLYFDEIISIEPDLCQPVYDMTVNGYRNFIGDFVYSNSGVVEETADFVLTLWSPDTQRGKKVNEKEGVVKLKIVKSRHGGVGTEVNLQFAPNSLAMIPIGDPLAEYARQEHHWSLEGDLFEQSIFRHSTGFEDLKIPTADFEAWKASLV